jgi:biopolymer transport protein ExbB/TolQ
MGVLLHEFANSSYIEIKAIVLESAPAENLVDRIIDALDRTAHRLIDKMSTRLTLLSRAACKG